MRYILIVILLMFNLSVYGQDYFSQIIPFEAGNPAMVQLLYERNSYFVPVIYDSKTVVVSINEEQVDYNTIDSFTISRNGLCLFENSEFYYFGKDRSKSKGLEILNSPLDHSTLSSISIETDGDFNFPTTASKLRDSIFYCAFTKDFDSLDVKLPEFLALNLKTKEETRVPFNADLTYTVPWVINSTLDGNIFISSGIQFPYISKRLSQLIKMDRSGNTIWRNDGNEAFDNGGIPTWATELSDSTIVQTYYVDRTSDMEFLANDWFKYPIRLKWYSKDGDSIAEKYIITPKKQLFVYNGLKSGKGDYFFAYGGLEDWSIIFGSTHFYTHLTKFSNTGDTIWTRNYQHSNYAEPRIPQRIRDIYEHENGDISILANIAPVGEKNEIWLYKVNSDGCYINEECEDMSDLVGVIDDQEINRLTLFPNPAADVLNISVLGDNFTKIDILDQLGNTHISLNIPQTSETQIDIRQLPAGLYFMITQNGHQEKIIQRFIKL